jgi:hypothetical protein
MELLAVAKPDVSKWGEVKGEGTGGVYPCRWGPGAVPLGKFSKNRCIQVSLSAFFKQKSTH